MSAPTAERRVPATAARRLAATVAAHGLAGTLHEPPPEPLDPRAWRRFLAQVEQQRLTGLLATAVADGSWPVTEQQRTASVEAHLDATCTVLRLERELLAAVKLLRHAGVDSRVLKGSAVGHLDYPRTHERVFSDVDLLVRGADFDRAVTALTSAGYRRRFPEPRPGFDSRFSKGTSFKTPEGYELDLHRTFVMGPFGLLVDLDDVWDAADRFVLGGEVLSALSTDVRFLHACFHAALGDRVPRLLPQRDVVQMLLSDRLDLEHVRTLAHRWRAEVVVARAVALAWETLAVADVVALSAWAARYVPTAQEQRFLHVYSDPRGSYAAKELAALAAISGFRDKLLFLQALLLPDRPYVADRYSGPGQRLRRAMRAVARTPGRRP